MPPYHSHNAAALRRPVPGLMRAAAWSPLIALASLIADPASAAGGAHVVDDAAVETPGICHLETSVALSSGDSGVANASPGCTSEALPDLELGAFVSHGWIPDAGETQIGLTSKFALQTNADGSGIAISASLGYRLDRDRIESASAIVPFTVMATHRLQLNFNAGWQWTRSGGDDFFGGAQAMLTLKPDLVAMGEVFARDRGKAGGQAGLRWTVAKGSIDLDLLAGRYLDGATPTTVTFGVTLRR